MAGISPDAIVVLAGYGTVLAASWLRARTVVAASRIRATARHDLVSVLPSGSRVLDLDGRGIVVEVGERGD